MSNPLIDDLQDRDLIQTVSIALPTKGAFYEPGILSPEADPLDMEIRAIGVMAEMYARDPFLVAAGKGLGRIVSHVCPQVLKPDRLCEVDVEAILIAARLVSHGSEYPVKHKCENPEKVVTKDDDGEKEERVCEVESELKIDLQKIIMQYEPIEYGDEYMVDLSEFNQRVFLRPLEYRHALDVVKRGFLVEQKFRNIMKTGLDTFLTDESVTDEYAEAIDTGAQIALKSMADSIFCVESAGGVKVGNPNQILEWLDAIPETVGKRISEAATKVASDLRKRSLIEYECAQCGHKNSFQLVMDPQLLFFSDRENSKAKTTPSPTSKRNRRSGTRPPKTSRKSPTPSKESASNT